LIPQESQRLQAIFEHALDAIFLADDQARLIDANPAACRLTGYNYDELLSRSLWDLTSPAYITRGKIRWQQLLKEGSRTNEGVLQRRDGTLLRIEYHAVANIISGLHLFILRDISERKLAQETLQQLNAQLKRRNRELIALHEIGQKFITKLNLDDVYQTMYDEIGQRLLGSPHLVVTLADEAKDIVVCDFAIIDGERVDPTLFPPIPLSSGVNGEVIRSRQPRIVDLQKARDSIRDQDQAHIGDEKLPMSGLYVPLITGDKVVGTINVQHYEAEAYSETDMTLLSILASQAAAAIENARLYEQAQQEIQERQQRERELAAIAGMSAALRSDLTRTQMLPVILDRLLEMLGAEGAGVAVYDSANGDIVIELAHGADKEAFTGLRFESHENVFGHVITGNTVYVTADTQQSDLVDQSNLPGSLPTLACVPLSVQEKVVGALYAARQKPFQPAEMSLLTAVADIAANALHRATLYEQTQTHAEQIDQIIRSVPDGVLLLDEQQRILLANPAAQTLLDRLAQANVGDILTQLGATPLQKLLKPPPTGQWHDVAVNKYTFEIISRPLVAGPTPAGWVMVLRDVTEGRLVRQQLQQQERLAAVGQLAAGIAHDFNNLMSIILLYTQLVNKSPELTDRNRERLATIGQQAEHAARMIQQILDFSRRSVMERQPLDLHSIIEKQVDLLQHTLPEHIAIDYESEPGQYTVRADPTRIQQIIVNLALNARDAMPHGGRLTFSLKRLEVNGRDDWPHPNVAVGQWICLTVKDTGDGIAPENLDHVFEPFFTTKAPGEGTGLGLAQVHGIVAQHGGHIVVESQLGEGTAVVIYLPALVLPTQTWLDGEQAALPQGSGELVLVVEDNEVLRAALIDYLQMWRYQTIEAANGEEALAQLTEHSKEIALVLSDAIMPRMGGVDLVRVMQQEGYKVPVILLTGHPLDEAEVNTLRTLGLHAWLSKPPDVRQLSQLIAQALVA
jgi:two-component system, cell cycle sensor histidine kinase and response regulator CckA